MSERTNWKSVVAQAAEIVRSYDTSVTLRQLYYRLVSAELIPNAINAYECLSRTTAAARRDGWFPQLLDRDAAIHRYGTWTSPEEAVANLRASYRRDRTEGQVATLYLVIEKAGIVEQLTTWFGDLGVPIVSLGGYASQSHVDMIRRDIVRQRRPAVLLYGGDHDASGEDIDRDFVERVDLFDDVVRVALNADQVDEYQLPRLVGKDKDARAAAFVARHGANSQVEVDALPPEVLRRLYQRALDQFWDDDTYEACLTREDEERAAL